MTIIWRLLCLIFSGINRPIVPVLTATGILGIILTIGWLETISLIFLYSMPATAEMIIDLWSRLIILESSQG